jgi:hypothetical protein
LFPARNPIVRVLEHVGVARKEPAARGSPNTALDLHDGDRIIRETPEESCQRAGGEMTSTLALAVQLRFPASLDVDHRERIVQ